MNAKKLGQFGAVPSAKSPQLARLKSQTASL
jgi:hypothetical protein